MGRRLWVTHSVGQLSLFCTFIVKGNERDNTYIKPTNSDKTPSDSNVSDRHSYIDVVEGIELDENPYDEIVTSSSESTASNEDNRNSYIDVIDQQGTSDNIYDQVTATSTERNIYDGTFYITDN